MLRFVITAALAYCVSVHMAWAEGQGDVAPAFVDEFGMPPEVPDGPLQPDVVSALEDVLAVAMSQSAWSPDDADAFDVLAKAEDPRLIWILADMQRFAWRQEFYGALTDIAAALAGRPFESGRPREEIINAMIAWDVPAYPGYLAHKRQVFTRYISGWEALFVAGDVPWHLVDWGGVDIDARPFGATDEVCHCIPAADNPEVSSAADATWLEDDDIIFGVVVNGEARAYPRRIMEVREMVNDTLGGRDLGIPYCTLCGAAQAYFTDGMPAGVKRPVLRTSGLLLRSNKVMYDVETNSLFDTFLGKAVTGPLAEIELELERVTVITSDWGTWRRTYPETTVLVEALALGRDYNLRETRDAFGPIFPVGDVDPRLPVHEDVIGLVTGDGTPVAFPRAAAVAALKAGEAVAFSDVTLELLAGGVRALGQGGADLGSHEAFWFAWSQFHPETVLWEG